MASICKLFVVNQKVTTRKVGKSLLAGGQRGLVNFTTMGQLKEALKMHDNGTISIETDIPSYLKEQLEAELPSGMKPLQTETVKGNYPPGEEDPNFDDTVMTKEDVEKAAEEGKEEEDVEKEDIAHSDIPGTQYAQDEDEKEADTPLVPESAKTGFKDGFEDNEAAPDKEDEEGEYPSPELPDSAKTNSVDGQAKNESESATSDEKPEWYLTHDEVEGSTKKDLTKWIDENNLDINKGSNAGELKENVHEYLSKEFPDHAE